VRAFGLSDFLFITDGLRAAEALRKRRDYGMIPQLSEDDLALLRLADTRTSLCSDTFPEATAEREESSLNYKAAQEAVTPHDAIAHHQNTDAGWRYHPVIREVLRWKGIFNHEFKLDLPDVAFCIGFTRRNCHGYFRPGHNWYGFKREILLKEDSLLERVAEGRFWEVLGTTLHELLHAWQDLHGVPGRNNYHNAEIRGKALECGEIIDERGYTTYVDGGRFFQLLQKYGVAEIVIDGAERFQPQATKLKKWVCGCQPQYGVRVAIEGFTAVCLRCHQEFSRAEC
jgi:hypothetical protein